MSIAIEATLAQQIASRPNASTWVSANAGSGKTTVLTSRVARLLLHGCNPQNILCLTFTKAAAAVMQNRLFSQLGKWAMQPADDLRNHLLQLGEPPEFLTHEVVERARTLFAAALETPGGLKIQTIHSFCDSVLRRFPLEAGVSPAFETLDASREALYFDEILVEMAQAKDTQPFDAMAAYISAADDAVGKLVRKILSKREQFLRPFDEVKLRKLLGLPAAETLASLYQGLLGNQTQDLLESMVVAWRQGKLTDLKSAEKAKRILMEVDNPVNHSRLEDLFLHGKSANVAGPFSAKVDKWATVDVVKNNPDLTEAANDLADKIEKARPQRLALLTLNATKALYDFAADFLRIYDLKKAEHGFLDFNDQIRLVRKMLNNGDAAQWVKYKLDGVISHILVDEAQDTSPAQWDIIEALSEDFFHGEGAHSELRTIFVVGDEKQSIYSFQGADAQEFKLHKQHFAKALSEMPDQLEDCQLLYSFRSAPPILALVDQVMADSTFESSVGTIKHLAADPSKPGRIEVWDRLEKDAATASPPWYLPDDQTPDEKPMLMLAKTVAAWIKQQLAEATIPDGDKLRRLLPGDVLVLVRRRRDFFHALLNALKALDLPVSGADRFKLTEELAVRDILAVLTFATTPFDDLSLANALKSPLCGLGESQLFALAHGRGKSSLWERLIEHRDQYPQIVSMFETLRDNLGFARPFECLEIILTQFEGRKKLIGRLGSEAAEGIDELLSQALEFESLEPPTLTGFLNWLEQSNSEISRQQDEGGNLIRVMTVHGAKGLEAPLVILPDTAPHDPQPNEAGVYELEDGSLAFSAVSADMTDEVSSAKASSMEDSAQERQRLLYVALTRAEYWLAVFCAGGERNKSLSWHDQISAAFSHLSPIRREHSWFLETNWPTEYSDKDGGTADWQSIQPSDWMFEKLARPKARPAPINPSQLGGAHALAGEYAQGDENRSMARGSLLHSLLEQLPACTPSNRLELANIILAKQTPPDLASETAELRDEALAVVQSPELAFIFRANSHPEIPFNSPLGTTAILGRIDRLIIGPNKILAVDFKSNRLVPTTAVETPEGLLRQLGAYATALTSIFPDKEIETCILWTKTCSLMVVPQNLVMDAFARRMQP